jgi:hypothetical protein
VVRCCLHPALVESMRNRVAFAAAEAAAAEEEEEEEQEEADEKSIFFKQQNTTEVGNKNISLFKTHTAQP